MTRPVPLPNESVAQAAVPLLGVVVSLALGHVALRLKGLAVFAPRAIAFMLLPRELGLERTLRAVRAEELEYKI